MIGDNKCMLQGNKGMQYPMLTISSDKMDKVLDNRGQISILQCYGLQVVCHNTNEECRGSVMTMEIIPAYLQKVLQEFGGVFKEPDQLPPWRDHDYKIQLVEGAKPVNIRPYRYGSLQKNVIEEMTLELLKSGVIQKSFSFIFPIVLMKKNMGSRECA